VGTTAAGAAAAGAGPSLEQSSSGASSSSGATSQAGTSTTPTSTSGNRSPSFASRKTDCDEPPTYRPLLLTPVNPRKKAGAALALTIAVNGWVSSPEDYAAPWRSLPGGGCDRLALVWERDLLLQLGVALSQFIKNKAVEESGKMVGGVGVPGGAWCAAVLVVLATRCLVVRVAKALQGKGPSARLQLTARQRGCKAHNRHSHTTTNTSAPAPRAALTAPLPSIRRCCAHFSTQAWWPP
jgi:hypothetical protein